jgi:hypothetical protein
LTVQEAYEQMRRAVKEIEEAAEVMRIHLRTLTAARKAMSLEESIHRQFSKFEFYLRVGGHVKVPK